jgi:6-phosphogluconolactonase
VRLNPLSGSDASMIKLVAIAALLFLVPISNAASVDVYFGTGGRTTKGIYHAKFDTETGKLSPAKLAAEIGGPGFLAFSPDKTRLYAVCQKNKIPSVAAYSVNSDGSLELLNTTPIGDGGGAHISVHPSNQFIMTAQYGGGSAAVYPIEKNGRVGKQSQLIEHEGGSGVAGKRQDKPHPHWTGYSPDGKFAFVPDLGLDQVVIYRVNANNRSISPHGILHGIPGGGPRHMKFSVDGKFIYLLNELELSVTTFKYNATAGSGKQLTTTRALSPETKAKELFNSSSEIIVHPNGRFVYSANRGNDSVTVYNANPKTGKLVVKEVQPIRGAWPRNINMDANGRWLLAAGADSNTISVFEIDQENGELTFQTKSIINVPGSICIVFKE